MEYEGETEDDVDAVNEAFESIILESDRDDLGDEETEHFFTSFGKISSAYARDITDTLATNALLCSLAPTLTDDKMEAFMADKPRRYSSTRFFGIIIDTRALARSIVGYD